MISLLNEILLSISSIFVALCLFPKALKRIENSFNKFTFITKINSIISAIEQRYHKYIFGAVLLIGAIIRVWDIGSIPDGFNQDEAMAGVDALALSTYNTDRFGMWLPAHFTGWDYGQMSVLLSYLMVPFIKIFGFSIYTVRLPIIIISITSIIFIYLLCKELFGKNIALIGATFTVINPWHFMQSRWALDCNMLPHFFLFSVYFLVIAIRKNKKYAYLSMFFFGLTMYTYGIAWYSVPVFIAIVSLYYLAKKTFTMAQLIKYGLVYLFVAFPIFGVMTLNFFKLPTIRTPFCTIPFFSNSQRSVDIIFFSDNAFSKLFSNLKTAIYVSVIQRPDLPWNSIPEFGTIYLFSIPFIFIGILALYFYFDPFGLLLKKSKTKIDGKKNLKNDNVLSDNSKKLIYFPLIAWIIVSILSGIIINDVNINRMNIIFYPIIILVCIGIYEFSKKLTALIPFVVILYTTAFVLLLSTYFGSYSVILANNYYHGFDDALVYLDSTDCDKIFITNYTQGMGSKNVSEILTMAVLKIDALYFQGKKNINDSKGITFLPYRKRYVYVDIDKLDINPREKEVYVINKEERKYFPENTFEYIDFGNYLAVKAKLLH